jgi:hypothetical protein
MALTESEWLTSRNRQAMLDAAWESPAGSGRKHRLLAVAFCRRLWQHLPDVCRNAVENAERLAEGAAVVPSLRAISTAVMTAFRDGSHWYGSMRTSEAWTLEHLYMAAVSVLVPDPLAASLEVARNTHSADSGIMTVRSRLSGGERNVQAGLIRDVYGPLPFRTVAIDDTWLTWNNGTVPAIARRIYDERAFHDMPLLGDALEDAGCNNQEMLDHCRKPGVHVKGCWVVDLALGRQ